MRPPDIQFERYAIWYGIAPDFATEVEYEKFNWRVSMYQPVPKGILRTTVYLDRPKDTDVQSVVRAGIALIKAWGGEETLCNGLPPNTTVCYKRK